jgi:hypothetical protein
MMQIHICLLMVSLTTLSEAHIMLRRMLGCSENRDFKKMGEGIDRDLI